MYSFIPLLFALILINGKQLKKSLEYRFRVFALVGGFFFFLFPFTNYTFEIFNLAQATKIMVTLIETIVVVALCFAPWIKQQNFLLSGLIGIISLFAIISYLTMDTSIKNTIARLGGYYSEKKIDFGFRAIQPEKHKSYIMQAGAYRIDVPETWKKRVLKDKNKIYFVRTENEVKIAEFRPNCIPPLVNDIPSMIQSTKTLLSHEAINVSDTCRLEHDNIECLVKATYPEKSNKRSRWHWYYLPCSQCTGAEFDILFFDDSNATRQDALFILRSINLLQNESPDPSSCSTPIQWM